MTPSEELELNIYRFAEQIYKAQWQAARLTTLSAATQNPHDAVLADALHDLYARKCLELRRWENSWVAYDGIDRNFFFNGDFHIRVTFSGRKYFEGLEAQAAEENRLDRIPATRLLAAAEHQASLRELKEAHSDLSKRPAPDLTGVVQHCMAALECTAKLIAGNDNGTLGDVLKERKLNLPPHLSEILNKAWGFASERGRHVHDNKPISYPDAELVLALCEAMIVYLLRTL